jgi:hypothetical protein
MKLGPKQQAWLDALKSGKYAQGTKALKVNLGGEKVAHCCLGVLCETLGLQSSLPKDAFEYQFTDIDSLAGDRKIDAALNARITQEIKLRSMNGAIEYSGLPQDLIARLGADGNTLAGINDYVANPWPKIIEIMEKYPDAVFTAPA